MLHPGLYAEVAGTAMVAGIWQGFVVVAAVWLFLRLVPRSSATLRFAAWSLVFVLIALLPFLEVSGHASSTPPAHHSAIALDLRWSLALAAIWLAISVYRLANLSWHGLRLRGLGRRAVVVAAPGRCSDLLRSSHRPIQLCTSTEIDRPSVIGFTAPRILVPAWLFDQISESELEQVILHEMEHLRRGDDWLNLLQKVMLALLPLNPMLLWVERRLCLERELACDDGVLRRTNAPRAYASCLTSLAERGMDRRVLALALGALERQSQLARRVHRILRREAALSPLQSRMLTGAIAMVLIACATGLSRCPELITFSASGHPLAASTALPSSAFQPAPLSGSRVEARAVVYRETAAPQVKLMNASFRLPAPNHTPVMAKHTGLHHGVRTTETYLHSSHAGIAGQQTAPQPLRSSARRVSRTQNLTMLTSWPAEQQPVARVAQDISSAAGQPGDGRSEPRAGTQQPTQPAAMQTTFFYPYAAFRVDGGWLIVQL